MTKEKSLRNGMTKIRIFYAKYRRKIVKQRVLRNIILAVVSFWLNIMYQDDKVVSSKCSNGREFASVHLQLVNSRRMNLEYIVQYCGVTSQAYSAQSCSIWSVALSLFRIYALHFNLCECLQVELSVYASWIVFHVQRIQRDYYAKKLFLVVFKI